MKKTVTENHNISEAAGGNVAEELIAQQNPGAEFVIGDDDEPEAGKVEAEESEAAEEPEAAQKPEAAQEPEVAEKHETHQEPEAARETPLEENIKNKGRKAQGFTGTVVLIGAASYLDGGTRFLKNAPVKITDKNMYEHLLKTGLFVHF